MVDIPEEVFERFERVERKIMQTKRAILAGMPATETASRRRMHSQREEIKQAAEDAAEAVARAARAARAATQERIIGTNDILFLGFFHAGLFASRAVGRINIADGLARATGFLVSPEIVMTNEHVLPDTNYASAAEIDFEDFDVLGTQQGIHSCRLDPARFFFADAALDVALVAVEDSEHSRAATIDLGWHPMIGGEGKILIGDPVNIIQYPGGIHKSIVVHNSNLVHLENNGALDDFCWYTSDTQRGSSGSPVFNTRWEIIAVHHRSIPQRNNENNYIDTAGRQMTEQEYLANPERALYVANEGSRTSRIVRTLRTATFDDPAQTAMRDALLDLWEGSRLINHGQLAARESARRGADVGTPPEAGRSSDPRVESIIETAPSSRPGHGLSGLINIHVHFGSDRF